MITAYHLENNCQHCQNPMQLCLNGEFEWQAECMVCLKKQGRSFSSTDQAFKAGFVLKKHNTINGKKNDK